MKKIPSKKFLPVVSLEEALAYNPQLPETRTASAIVNAVLDALEVLPVKNVQSLSDYLEIERHHLNGAVMVAMGVGISELRDEWILARYIKMHSENPKASAQELAREVGFQDHSGLCRFLKRMKHEELINKRNVRPDIEPFDIQKWIAGGNKIF